MAVMQYDRIFKLDFLPDVTKLALDNFGECSLKEHPFQYTLLKIRFKCIISFYGEITLAQMCFCLLSVLKYD